MGAATLYLIGAVLLVAFVAIGLWIARDARRALPESRRPRRGELVAADGAPRPRPADVKRRARARGRAQRRARRRNR
jgi:hypothetical protein